MRSGAGSWLDRRTSFFVLLALLMLLPAACVLWFMNEAVRTQSAAARQRVLEAYRGQLRLVRARVDAHWRAHAALLHGPADPEARFGRLIEERIAEGAVFLSAGGVVVYPDRARNGVRVGAILQQLADVERLAPGEGREHQVDRLAVVVNDYAASMPAPDRLMLMTRLRALAPNVRLPTEAALRPSTDLIAAGLPPLDPGRFQPTAIRDVWALTSDNRQVIALYRTGRLESTMHDFLHQVTPAGIVFIALPPGSEDDAEAIAAGPSLPGWQITFQPLDMTPFDAAARRQAVGYVSVAAAGIAIIIVLGAVAARSLRRHLDVARLKTDLAAAVSHELRTPLASMRVLVDGLLADRSDPAKTGEYLGLLAAEHDRLNRLVDHFLTFSRVERGREHFVFAPASPSSIAAAAVEAMRDRLPPDCDFRMEVAPDLPPVIADADALATALVNLLDNALKYTASEKRILLRVYRDGQDTVALAVCDNGIGIPPRELRRIFRRFYRVDRRLARSTGGVGLGLSIVDLIVRAHGGTVAVASESGVGSTFTLRLPCAPEGVAA